MDARRSCNRCIGRSIGPLGMLHYFTIIVCCQLVGELIVTALKAPLPGPVLGMTILFAGIVWNGGIPDDLAKVADGLLLNLSLLFVPAGTGIMLHAALIGRDVVPISVALVVSTVATVVVTALMMTALSRPAGDSKDGTGA